MVKPKKMPTILDSKKGQIIELKRLYAGYEGPQIGMTFADGTDWILNDDLEAIEYFMALLRAMRQRARQRARRASKQVSEKAAASED